MNDKHGRGFLKAFIFAVLGIEWEEMKIMDLVLTKQNKRIR